MQVGLLHDDTSRIKLDLIPMIEEIICEWHIIHFLAITPSESAAVEDFSSQLSLLQIGRCKVVVNGIIIWANSLSFYFSIFFACCKRTCSYCIMRFKGSANQTSRAHSFFFLFIISVSLLTPRDHFKEVLNVTSDCMMLSLFFKLWVYKHHLDK